MPANEVDVVQRQQFGLDALHQGRAVDDHRPSGMRRCNRGMATPGPTSFEVPLLSPPLKVDRPAVAGESVGRFFDLFKALPPSARWITVRPNGHGIDLRRGRWDLTARRLSAVLVHPIPFGRFRAAQDETRANPISPTTMRKSLPRGEGSSDILEAFACDSGAMHRFQKGIPFNWRPYFYGVHNQNPDGSDGGTEPHAEHTDSMEFLKPFRLVPGGSPSAPTAMASMVTRASFAKSYRIRLQRF
jgi:hypothetical protein